MTDDALTPDRQLALASTAPTHRPALAAILALDQRLAGIVRAARDPMIGKMRLTWWHDALGRLDTAPAPAEPLLRALAATVLPSGVTGATLATMIEGWEPLLDDPGDASALDAYARGRGGALFAIAARCLGNDGVPAMVTAAGQGWALADLARHAAEPAARHAAAAIAPAALARGFTATWPRPLRPLGVLALSARLDADAGSPLAKSWMVMRFRMIGR